MSIADLAEVLRRRWKLAASVFVSVLLLALILLLFIPAQKRASITFVVLDQSSTGSPLTARNGNFLSQERVKSYASLLGGDHIAAEVSSQLGGSISPAKVQDSLTVDSQPDTVVINVIAANPSADTAVAMANDVGDSFTAFVEELEKPTPQASPLVRVQTVAPASIVPSPAWQRPAIYIVVGIVAGAALAVAATTIVERFDTSVKTAEDLRGLSGVPNLATVPRVSDSKQAIEAFDGNSSSRLGEAYRQARTNIQFIGFDNNAKTLLITSALPGEGKSTVACNLAAVIAKSGSSVLLIDADMRRPVISEYLGLVSDVGLSNVLAQQVPVSVATQPQPVGQFHVLASGTVPPNPSELLSSQQMRSLLTSLSARYDVILIDSPPVLAVTDAAALSSHVDGVIFTVKQGSSSKNDVKMALDSLSTVHAKVVGTVLNMASDERPEGAYGGYYHAGNPHLAASPAPPRYAGDSNGRKATVRATNSEITDTMHSPTARERSSGARRDS